MSDNMKDYREKELKTYVISCGIIMYLILSKGSFYDNKNIINISEIIDTSLVSVIITSFIYIIDGLLSPEVKNWIVFMFTMPAETVFTKELPNTKDIRIDKNFVNTKYKNVYDNIPNNQKERRVYENTNWYRIYLEHKDVGSIRGSQRDYLLLRDITVANSIIFILYVIISIKKDVVFNGEVLIFLLLLYITTMVATHIKSKRFCINVIAYDLSKNKE